MTISEEGLVLGAAVLAPMRNDAFRIPALAIDGAEERILALLAVVYGKAVANRKFYSAYTTQQIMPLECTWREPGMLWT
jgi:hypothetical protein